MYAYIYLYIYMYTVHIFIYRSWTDVSFQVRRFQSPLCLAPGVRQPGAVVAARLKKAAASINGVELRGPKKST